MIKLLDIRTILFLSTLSAFTISTAMLIVSRRFPGHVGSAFKLWGIGLGLSGISHILFIYRDNIPGFLGIITANTLIMVTLDFYYFAIKDLHQDKTDKRLPIILTIIQCLFFCYFYYIDDRINVRFFVMAITSSTMILLICKSLFFDKPFPKQFIHWLTLSIAALILMSIGFKFIEMLLISRPMPSPIANNLPEEFLFICAFLVSSVIPLLFVLIAGDEFNIEISRLANRDSLTGIYNRRAFQELSRKALLRILKSGQHNSLLALDLDHFKNINDKFGHNKGDEVLLKTTKAIQSCLRETDIFGRYGGEEFCVFLPGANPDEAKMIAERLRRAVSEIRIPFEEGYLPLTISIGLISRNTSKEDLEIMIHKADEALYEAKTKGRNQVCTAE